MENVSQSLSLLPTELQNQLKAEGIEQLTPVQAAVIPPALSLEDLLVQAPTGSGKTLAFVLPVLKKLEKHSVGSPRALVLCPTRELASQVAKVFTTYGKNLGIRVTLVSGGASEQRQTSRLGEGSDVVVGTPGRVTDLSERKILKLDKLTTFVLDEVDQMLDVGFQEDLTLIMKLIPKDRQTLFFSATMDARSKSLAETMLRNPKNIQLQKKDVNPQIEHLYVETLVGKEAQSLANLLLYKNHKQAIIFCEQKRECNEIVESLKESQLNAAALHGDLVQADRNRVLSDFRSGKLSYLVATNVAARGIDVQGLPLVVNLCLPWDSDTYTHRVGRTGRAGQKGEAWNFVTRTSVGKFKRLCGELRIEPAPLNVPTVKDILDNAAEKLKKNAVAYLETEMAKKENQKEDSEEGFMPNSTRIERTASKSAKKIIEELDEGTKQKWLEQLVLDKLVSQRCYYTSELIPDKPIVSWKPQKDLFRGGGSSSGGPRRGGSGGFGGSGERGNRGGASSFGRFDKDKRRGTSFGGGGFSKPPSDPARRDNRQPQRPRPEGKSAPFSGVSKPIKGKSFVDDVSL
jgi:superfamily II DNA/RNA helicase